MDGGRDSGGLEAREGGVEVVVVAGGVGGGGAGRRS